MSSEDGDGEWGARDLDSPVGLWNEVEQEIEWSERPNRMAGQMD
jgi:hypothetical protein